MVVLVTNPKMLLQSFSSSMKFGDIWRVTGPGLSQLSHYDPSFRHDLHDVILKHTKNIDHPQWLTKNDKNL